MWFKTTSSGKQVLFSYGSLATNQEFGLWLNSGGATMTAWGYGADKTFTLASAVNDGNWHQVVKTYDGTSIQLYVDGAALAAQAAARSTTMDSYGFVIGAILNSASGDYGNFFNGSLDEVSLYSTVLSQATVTNHYELRNLTPVGNVAPTGTSATLTATEDTPRTLTTADFGYADPEEGHDLQAVKVTTLPADGTLKLNGTSGDRGPARLRRRHRGWSAGLPPGRQRQRHAVHLLHLPGAGQRRHRQRRRRPRPSPNTLTFNVTAVNDTPSFTKGADQTVTGDTGAHSIPNWATNVSTGPADESGQTLTFTVTTPAARTCSA